MGETPFEPFFHGPPERRRERRGSHRMPLERSFRCRASLRGPAVAPLERYEDFVRMHEAMSARPRVRAGLLWLCGVSTAMIVSAMMLGGVALVREWLGIAAPVFIAEGAETETAAFTTALCGGVAVLQATGLLHVLLAVADRPVKAFSCIGAMAVTLATLLPLTLRVAPDVALATAGLNLAGGTAAVGLLAVVASSCVDWPERPSGRRRRRR
jgi:hypothetical protein